MRISLTLPQAYERFDEIKKSNYPYRVFFLEYLNAIAHLASREQLSHWAVFGRIEHALSAGQPLVLGELGPNNSTLDLRFENSEYPDLVDFFNNAPLTHKKVVLMAVVTLMRVSQVYGTSIPEIIYLIDTLEQHQPTVQSAAPAQPVVQAQTPVQSAAPSSTPVQTQPVQPAAPQPVAQTQTQTQAPVRIKKKRVKTTDSKPATKRPLPKAEPLDPVFQKPTPKPAVSDPTFEEPTPTPRPRKTEDRDTLRPGAVVATNPLLNDFFDQD